jgi:hypothetical protein
VVQIYLQVQNLPGHLEFANADVIDKFMQNYKTYKEMYDDEQGVTIRSVRSDLKLEEDQR